MIEDRACLAILAHFPESVDRHRTMRHVLVVVFSASLAVGGCGRAPQRDVPRVWKSDPNRRFVVRVTGRQFNWHVQYPGRDDALGTQDDIFVRRHLHLPTETKVRLELTSDDYLYTLSLPHWNLKEIAVPELVFPLEFETTEAGQFVLLGDQMCGYAHPDLLGQLTVESHEDFDAWLRQRQAMTCCR